MVRFAQVKVVHESLALTLEMSLKAVVLKAFLHSTLVHSVINSEHTIEIYLIDESVH